MRLPKPLRPILTAAVLLAVAACQGPQAGDAAPEVTKARAFAEPAPPAISGTLAKALFGAKETPSGQQTEAIGSYAKGCLAGAQQLPQSGPTWQAMRLSRNRDWGTPELIDYIEDFSRKAAEVPGWNGIYVGDMSQPRGGPMSSGHASHQMGLDVDIWLLPGKDMHLTAEDREKISAISYRRQAGAFTNDKWTPEHMQVIKDAASDPRVARIFLFPGGKVWMCKHATGNRDWLRKVRPWFGHDDHIHVRLHCPAGMANCQEQAAPPPGDGCAEAQTWVDSIVSPPPPNPDAKPAKPKPPLTLARMPAQCVSVLQSAAQP